MNKLYKPLSGIIKNKFARKKKYQNFFKLLHGFSVSAMNYGYGSKFRESGEIEALKYIDSKIKASVIFDVGANMGNYTKSISEFLSATIYCFEPSTYVFQKLQQNVSHYKNVHCFKIALSDKEGTATLYSRESNHEVSSLINTSIDKYGKTTIETVFITTLDNFCSHNNIDQIDFLKIDVEGYELSVLNGAKNMLYKKKIIFIQFEFGKFNIDSRTFFRDFWILLHENYIIYRIVKDGLFEIKNYTAMLEIFETSNFIAELKR
jgi:FkbM family methyltransferase